MHTAHAYVAARILAIATALKGVRSGLGGTFGGGRRVKEGDFLEVALDGEIAVVDQQLAWAASVASEPFS